MNPVDVIELAGGIYACIYPDYDAERPFSSDDSVRIVVLSRRYIDPSDGACGCNPDELAAWENDHREEWFIIPLFLYDHSGTVYRTGNSNPFTCPWDSSRVGIIALNRTAWGSGDLADEVLESYAASIADEYTKWANGECYGYVLYDRDGGELSACWGFIGLDYAASQARAAAS